MRRFVGVLILSSVLTALGCTSAVEREARERTGGDPEQGLKTMGKYGCSSCHVIPGIAGSMGTKGPALKGVANRARIGADLPNTPENLINWLMNPLRYDRYTDMPNQGISEPEARNIAAYLLTLR